ncbi:hypothetical protein COMNV_00028 [Commensalibacter sp. Nvir]|uniref:hypothetical protein n=1 Tax=Commensalibacter sp. Nvir TaxID=3069817 RepID=UPI002D562A0D|nr:hypothetical protein COMNV_00028 [Commensalibacter sp. Nvir]
MNNFNLNLNLYSIIFGLIITTFSTVAAISIKKRKGLSEIWVLLTFLCSPLLFVMELLPSKNKHAPTIISCPVCHKDISSEVNKCHHCGHLLPRKYKPTAIVLETLPWILWIIYIIFLMSNPITNAPINIFGNGLPKCDSEIAKYDVGHAFEGSQLRRNLGLSLILIDQIETINSLPDRISCKAHIELNDTTEHTMNYEFYIQNNTIYVKLILTS